MLDSTEDDITPKQNKNNYQTCNEMLLLNGFNHLTHNLRRFKNKKKKCYDEIEEEEKKKYRTDCRITIFFLLVPSYSLLPCITNYIHNNKMFKYNIPFRCIATADGKIAQDQ